MHKLDLPIAPRLFQVFASQNLFSEVVQVFLVRLVLVFK